MNFNLPIIVRDSGEDWIYYSEELVDCERLKESIVIRVKEMSFYTSKARYIVAFVLLMNQFYFDDDTNGKE